MSGFESNWSPATPAVRVSYGPQDVNEVGGGQTSSSGLTKELVYEFDYENMPAYNAGTGLEVVVPTGAKITAMFLEITAAFTGATAFTVYLADSVGGTDVTLITDLGAAPAIGVTNTTATLPLLISIDGELSITTAGTMTAGVGKVVLEYID